MRLTASALPRAEACIGSAVLPGIAETGEYAMTGTAVDEFVQRAKQGDKAAALKAAPEEMRQYLDALTLDAIPEGAEFQVAFALNVVTGEVRRIPNRTQGYPEMPPEWIYGSTDIVGVIDADTALLLDLKWGTSTIGRDPAEDLQLGCLSVMLARYCRVSNVKVGFLRAGWDGVLRPETAMLDEWALDGIMERIRAVWRRQQAAEAPPLHVGSHCTYCPARRACPAMLAPAAMVLAGDVQSLAAAEPVTLDVLRARIGSLTLAEEGTVYEIACQMQERAKLIKGIIRDNARLEPVPLGDGKELREVQWGSRQASEAHKAREAALEAEGKASGEVRTVKVTQVRPMKARKA